MKCYGRERLTIVTAETERKLEALLGRDLPQPDLNSRLLHVLAIHVRKCGQEELGEKVEDILLQCEDRRPTETSPE